ncbi:MAG: enoyl-acyl-carrier protein reductase I [Rhodocyclaceae bacterium]|nr:MAG: enoyl-acyl-carrier protein reductase I [Rhodocyclaceae bacterium]
MGFLADKKILITGLLSKHSIAYGIAKACHREGAQLAFTYQTERFEDRIKKFAAEFGSDITIPVDVASDEQIDNLFVELAKHWDGLDGLVHSIAYAPTEAIEGDFLNGISRESFRIAHEISSYSYPALVKAARPMMQGRKSAALALSYLGAERTMPNYNTMGLAKASLEAATRYLAFCLGPEGIRANAISAGPIKSHFGRPDQDPGRFRHRQLRQTARLQLAQCPATSQRDHRGSRQRRRLHVVRSGQRHYR